ncbi:MAG: hypothetical protein NTW89_07820 [Burkholderiales bacterium]|jgi:hypothetical protein|nr:hypothetical protein [Burkholderiales bacterium]
MEKRITVLEVLAQQHTKSIDRLDRSIADLRGELDRRFSEVSRVQHEFRADVDRRFCEVNRTQQDFRAEVDRKFVWVIGMQFTSLIAVLGAIAKLANLF